jgi:UDP-N-acetylglucosamine--N-acetylmuramyl-(pentapeptide) pyrophosphoryl-undecaprenol N-acetylglucosamine transferase
MEQALVTRAGLKIEAIPAGGLRGKNPMTALRNLWKLGQGLFQSRQIIRSFKPEVLFVTGGYVSVPVTLAARQMGIPVLIYLPDIEPGFAIKFLARFANRVAVTVAEAQQFFKPGLTVVTGYPVTPALFAAPEPRRAEQKSAARHRLELSNDWPVLLVFGGSRGARSINRAVTDQLEAYLQISQVVHVTGTLDEAWVQARRTKLPPALQARYFPSAYLHEEKVDAFLAADLIVSRAGASILGEVPAAGLPAVLVPYPYAGAHQSLNADYLVQHQAAVVVKDADLTQCLKKVVIDLLTNTDQLQRMRNASRRLAQPDAADKLARQILEVRAYGN